MARRIGLVGYYGYGNYGDELFLDVFKQYLPGYEFVFLQDVLQRPFYLESLDAKVRNLDGILIGGGDLVIPDYWTDQYFQDEFLQKPIYMHGLGVPTWGGENAAVVQRLGRFFQHPNVRHIHVRDDESRAWITSKLAPAVPIDVTADIVCALDLPEVDRPSKPPIFGLITRKQKPGSIGWANIVRLCERAKMLGYRTRHIILGTGPVGQEDRDGASEFAFPGLETVSAECPTQLTRAIGECSAVASMKFHGCVVAFMFGVPAIGLITTDKFRNFFRLTERMELLGHHRHSDVDKRLPFHLTCIPQATIRELRQSAVGGLVKLKDRLERDLS